MTTITTKCRAFKSDRSPRVHRVQVADDGTIRVWDAVARHWTMCHSLSARDEARIRAKAQADKAVA